MKRSRQRGFSLLELLIVVSIIMTLAAIAVPNLLKARQNAYEAGAVGFLHTLQAEQLAYRTSNGEYAQSFNDLPELLGSDDAADTNITSSGGAPGGGRGRGRQGQGQGQGQGNQGQGQGNQGQGNQGQGQGNQGQGNQGQGNGGFGTQGNQGQGGNSGSSGGTTTSVMVRSNYIFTLTSVNGEQWNCIAEPTLDRYTGRYFYTDETGVIRYAVGAIASATSDIVQ